MENPAPIPIERIVGFVRTIRNDLVKELLGEEQMRLYYENRYRKELGKLRKRLLKRDLALLLNSPVDVRQYETMIDQITKSNSASLSLKNEQLFYHEIDQIFDRYAMNKIH